MVTEKTSHCTIHMNKRISWSAVLAGGLVGVGLGFLLNLFGIAIGLSAFAADSAGGGATIAMGGFIGIILCIIIGMLAAGYTSGYLGRLYCPKRNLGIIYGFITWSVALLLSVVIASPGAKYVAMYADSVSNASYSTAMTKTSAASKANTETVDKQEAQKVSTISAYLASGAAIVFSLFFIGAVSCCVGAAWGMMCPRDE